MRRWIFAALAALAVPYLCSAQYTLDDMRIKHKRGDLLHLGNAVALTGTWTVANAATAVGEVAGGAAGAALTELTAGDFVLIDITEPGTFVSNFNVTLVGGEWIWGYALTNCLAGEQCLIRFQPFLVQYVAPPPP